MASLFTPLFHHLREERFNSVYEPSEDSFLLIDGLEKDLSNILALRPTIVLEVGSGSGVVSAALASFLRNSCLVLTTDVNEKASEATLKTATSNGLAIESVTSDLLACFEPRLYGLVDILIFNPPYVVTSDQEVGSRGISASWAGGTKGRVVMNRLFPKVGKLLTTNGIFYLVIIRENDREDIQRVLSEQRLKCETIISRRTGMENLSVLKFTRY